jgi:inorganic pyrophosphatase
MIKALDFLGKNVEVIVDRPLGSMHPKHNMVYEVNYGYVPGIIAPDGEELDAYVLGINGPIKKYSGKCVAIIHRINDNDDKLVVAPEGIRFTDDEIEKLVEFQEKWFKHKIIR